MLPIDSNQDTYDPADQGDQRAKEDYRDEIDIVLHLLTSKTDHGGVRPHDSFTTHHAEQNHHNSREQAQDLTYLTHAYNGAHQPVTVLISRNGVAALVDESC